LNNTPPPQNLEAEQAVLGAVLLWPQTLDEVAGIINAGDFYRTGHGHIYRAMLDLRSRGEPVDLPTVTVRLNDWGRLDEVGGPVFLAALSEHVGTAANAGYYAKLVREKAVLRQFQALGQEIVKAAGAGTNLKDLRTYLESRAHDLCSRNGDSSKGLDLGSAILEAGAFTALDLPVRTTHIHPWLYDPSIVMFAGPRGIGKTQKAISLCDALTRGDGFGPWPGSGKPVNCCYLDGELVAQDIASRILDLTSSNDRQGKLFIYSDYYATLKGLKKANLNCSEWRSNMKAVLLENQVKVWVVDNIASLAPGIDENSKQDWDPINQWFLELRFADITTIFLHHTGKGGMQRGTSAREDNIDVSILLDWPKDYEVGEGARFVVKFKKARVKQEYVHLLTDTEFVLQKDEHDSWIWTWGAVKDKQIITFLKLYDHGKKQSDIAEILGVQKARVSKIKQKAISLGYMTEKGQITQSGMHQIL
jgi:hypothetical protein